MRIAVIAPPWLPVPPTAYGGTELVLDNLCRGLRAAGHDVLLCTTADSACPVERHATRLAHVGVGRANSVDELHHVIGSYDAAASWGAEVIHDHTITGPVWAQTRQGEADAPAITTNHGPFTPTLTAIYQRVAARVPVIAISHHQASSARGVPIAAVIHHGLDTSTLTPGRGEGGYALFLGRMNSEKGVREAIEVARRAGVPLRIAAKMREPEEEAYFRAEVEPLLGGAVEYLGEVGASDKNALLGSATCLLNPIAWPEPFGMVMIEALAAGTPVVATPRGAAAEIVTDGVTGFLRRGIDSLAAAVLAAGDLDRRACRREAVERFSMERMARDHLATYEALLDWRAAPGAAVAGLRNGPRGPGAPASAAGPGAPGAAPAPPGAPAPAPAASRPRPAPDAARGTSVGTSSAPVAQVDRATAS